MEGRIILTILISLSLFSCKFQKKSDAFDDFLKKSSDSPYSDEAITIIEENRSLNEPVTEDMDYSAIVDVPVQAEVPKKVVTEEPKGVLTPEEIRRYLAKGRYTKVLSYEVNPNDNLAKYYYGITHYCMAKSSAKGSKVRNRHARKAVALFKEVGVDETKRELKSRAILWHGITMLRLGFNSHSTAELLKPFEYIQENLKATKCYNDSLFYSAQVYRLRGERDAAEDMLFKLKSTPAKDRVYDVRYKKWVRPEAAHSHYMAMMDRPVSKPSHDEVEIDSFARKVEKVHKEIISGTDENAKTEVVTEVPDEDTTPDTSSSADADVMEMGEDDSLGDGDSDSLVSDSLNEDTGVDLNDGDSLDDSAGTGTADDSDMLDDSLDGGSLDDDSLDSGTDDISMDGMDEEGFGEDDFDSKDLDGELGSDEL